MKLKDLEKYANPTYFMKLTDTIMPWLMGFTIALLIIGLYQSLLASPQDYLQGQMVRMMYVHVPCSWLGMMGYGIITLSAIGALIWRHPLADVSVKAAAPIGAAFTFLSLLTGALWGRPAWGAYWVWDARLTSMLILLFLYFGLIALWQAIEDHSQAGRAAAILAIVGCIYRYTE